MAKEKKQQSSAQEQPSQEQPAQEQSSQEQSAQEQSAQEQSGGQVTQSAQTTSEADDLKDKYTRLAADFSNYKKRTAADRQCVYDRALAEVVTKILPLIDDLERALAAEVGDSPLKKGVEQIYTKTKVAVESLGVKEFGDPGEAFDVNIHEAVMQGPSDEYESGCVTDVFQKGYRIGDKVIRYAKVKVAE